MSHGSHETWDRLISAASHYFLSLFLYFEHTRSEWNEKKNVRKKDKRCAVKMAINKYEMKKLENSIPFHSWQYLPTAPFGHYIFISSFFLNQQPLKKIHFVELCVHIWQLIPVAATSICGAHILRIFTTMKIYKWTTQENAYHLHLNIWSEYILLMIAQAKATHVHSRQGTYTYFTLVFEKRLHAQKMNSARVAFLKWFTFHHTKADSTDTESLYCDCNWDSIAMYRYLYLYIHIHTTYICTFVHRLFWMTFFLLRKLVLISFSAHVIVSRIPNSDVFVLNSAKKLVWLALAFIHWDWAWQWSNLINYHLINKSGNKFSTEIVASVCECV